MQELLEKITIAPNWELLSQLGYAIYELGQEVVEIKTLIMGMKEKMKDIEAKKLLDIKANKELKLTLPEIEAVTRIDTEEIRWKILYNDCKKELLYAKYEWAKLIFEASKTRMIIEKKEF